jgi:GDP-L-fucose synthase
MSKDYSFLVDARVLVTGGAGVLGSALQRVLAGSRVGALLVPTRADCDLLDRQAVNRLFLDFSPSLIFHLAGRVSGVQGNITFAGAAFYDNAVININVIEAARLAGCKKVVAAGTTAIYSDLVPLPMKEDDLWLGAPHGSEGPYGQAKRAMLAQLEAYAQQYGLDYGYMICTNLYGPNDRFDETYGHVVPSVISRFHNAKVQGLAEAVVWGDGTPTRDFLYADDAARAFVTVAENGFGAFNTASGESTTIRELIETVSAAAGYEGKIRWDTSKPNGQQRRAYDISRLTSLAWRPEVRLAEGVKLTYDWFSSSTSVRR